MFHLLSRKPAPSQRSATSAQFVRRALSFGAALVLLWLALHLMPEARSAAPPRAPSDDAGTVAVETMSNNGLSWATRGQAAALLLLGLIGAAVYRHRKKDTALDPERNVRNLGRLQLGPQQHLHLIGLGDEVLLVGATNTHITLLHQITPARPAGGGPAIPAPHFSTPTATLHARTDFSTLLQYHIRHNTAHD